MKRPSKKNVIGCLVAIGLMIAVCIPLSHIWVGHIPEKYSYNKKLPEPSQIVSWVNMNSGIVQKQLDRRILQMREELDSASFDDAPEGICIKTYTVPVEGGEIKMYCVEPLNHTETDNMPVIIYYHGGAFYFPLTKGGVYSMAYYAKELGARVFIPAYRTSKQTPFPSPMLDCYNAAMYISDHAKELGVDINRLLLIGDSAGGCLTAGVTQYIRDHGGPAAKGVILLFPVTDRSTDYESKRRYRDAVWPENANENMWDIYLADGDHGMLKYAIPNQSGDFGRLPHTYIEAAEIDVLHDEAVAYADNLKKAGVGVEIIEVPGAYHGFDADQNNTFVREFLQQRVKFMKEMIDLPRD